MLKFKRMGEQELEASGLPWVILRPSRLTDGARPPAQQLPGTLAPAPQRHTPASCRTTCCLPLHASPHALSPPAGPYTSFDLNTLLKNTSGSRQDVTLSLRDDLVGEASRIAGGAAALARAAPRWQAQPAAVPGVLLQLAQQVGWHGREQASPWLVVPFAPPACSSPPAVAEAIVQSMVLESVEGRHFSIGSKEGDGPGRDPAKWRALFAACTQQQPAGVA